MEASTHNEKYNGNNLDAFMSQSEKSNELNETILKKII